MAQIKVVSVVKRKVVVDVTWSDGLAKAGLVVNDVPVEDWEQTLVFLTSYVTGVYNQIKAEADALAHANPIIDPLILAAVGRTFDNFGNEVA